MGHASRVRALALLGALYLPLLTVPVAAGERRVFPETGQASENAFYDYWQVHGQWAILGLPLSSTLRW